MGVFLLSFLRFSKSMLHIRASRPYVKTIQPVCEEGNEETRESNDMLQRPNWASMSMQGRANEPLKEIDTSLPDTVPKVVVIKSLL